MVHDPVLAPAPLPTVPAPTAGPPRHGDARVARVIALYEGMAPRDVARLHLHYADDAVFEDPFNSLQGVAAIKRLFAHLFVKLDEPRFSVRLAVAQGDDCFLTWDFSCRRRGRRGATVTIHGSSHLRFAADGRIALHRDYWDAAAQVYERVPLLGALLRHLRRQLAVPPARADARR